MALLRGFRTLVVRGSSEPILNHLFEESQAPYYRSTYPSMSELKEATLSFFPQFERLEFQLISAEQNQFIHQIADTTMNNYKRITNAGAAGNVYENVTYNSNAISSTTMNMNRPVLSHSSSLDSSAHSFVPRDNQASLGQGQQGQGQNVIMGSSNNTTTGGSNNNNNHNELSLPDAFATFSLQSSSPPFYPQQQQQVQNPQSQATSAIRRGGSSTTNIASGSVGNSNNIIGRKYDNNNSSYSLESDFNTSSHSSVPFVSAVSRSPPGDSSIQSLTNTYSGDVVPPGYGSNNSNNNEYEPFGKSIGGGMFGAMKNDGGGSSDDLGSEIAHHDHPAAAGATSSVASVHSIFGDPNNPSPLDSIMFGYDMGASVDYNVHRINPYSSSLDSNDPMFDQRAGSNMNMNQTMTANMSPSRLQDVTLTSHHVFPTTSVTAGIAQRERHASNVTTMSESVSATTTTTIATSVIDAVTATTAIASGGNDGTDYQQVNNNNNNKDDDDVTVTSGWS
jgi:hypothetical protein